MARQPQRPDACSLPSRRCVRICSCSCIVGPESESSILLFFRIIGPFHVSIFFPSSPFDRKTFPVAGFEHGIAPVIVSSRQLLKPLGYSVTRPYKCLNSAGLAK